MLSVVDGQPSPPWDDRNILYASLFLFCLVLFCFSNLRPLVIGIFLHDGEIREKIMMRRGFRENKISEPSRRVCGVRRAAVAQT